MEVDTSGDIPLSHVPDINLNLNVRGLKPSATLAVNELSAKLIQQGRRIYRMGLGQSPFPVPDAVVGALKKNAHQKDYLPVAGLHPLREAVAQYYRRNWFTMAIWSSRRPPGYRTHRRLKSSAGMCDGCRRAPPTTGNCFPMNWRPCVKTTPSVHAC